MICSSRFWQRGQGPGADEGVGWYTLNRLSCNTFLMAMSSPSFEPPTILAWNTTPNDPFPITLQLLYEISVVSPDLPSEATTLTILWGSSMAG
jgi:hypothetical protein